MMKRSLLFWLCMWYTLLHAQPIPVEAVAGNRHYWYQHVVNKPVQGARWGFFNTSSLQVFYDTRKPADLMSQSYLTYAVTKQVKLGAGSFYATVPGFKPSVHVQLFSKGKDHFVTVVPRVDVYKNPSYDVMLMAEYKPELGSRRKLYTRFQGMMNFTGTMHNRSYQSLRAGVDLGYMQLGLVAHFDAYGPAMKYINNVGVFVKKDVF